MERFKSSRGLEMHRMLARVLPDADLKLVRALAEEFGKPRAHAAFPAGLESGGEPLGGEGSGGCAAWLHSLPNDQQGWAANAMTSAAGR